LLDASLGDPLRDGWRFLRRLEQRLRILHGTGATLLDEDAPGLTALARRMGMHEAPRVSAEVALFEQYRAVTRDVRSAYLRVLGVEPAPDGVGQ
jgi:glutamate-ammonia-ligase adenylyltransferase